HPPTAAIALPEGSWGEGGFHHVWLNENTAWTWKEIYQREAQVTAFAQKYFSTDNASLRQILNQCARELLLMESSDWQFLISTVAARAYAELRIANHIECFERLAAIAEKVAGECLKEGEQKYFCELQVRDRVFADVDFGDWCVG